MSKSQIRTAALSARDAMDVDLRRKASLKVAEFASSLSIQPGEIVSGFYPIRSEIDVRPLMLVLDKLGISVCLPVVIDSQTIEFRRFEQGAELIATGFGTYGPSSDAEVVDPSTLLIPLAAFDDDGNRIGYGAGFYDRAIARMRDKGLSPRLIGVAFDCQRVNNVPAERHDVPLNGVLTETGLSFFKT